MRKSAFLGGILLCGLFLLAGCHPAALGTAAVETASRAATDSAGRSIMPTMPASPADTKPSTRTQSPAFTPAQPTGTGTHITQTPTYCSTGGARADGRTIPTLPAIASVQNIRGQEQSLPLDCESRSAVDFAGYFGVKINELEFFNKLPLSGDPNLGFVGNVRGQWGNLPPNAYGVYAGPVALLLRYYSVEAYAYRGMTWDQLRLEVAAGRPVIVWVVGHIARSTPVTMTVTGGEDILAARYEHTVILVGYDEKHAAVLDGSMRYTVPQDAFLTSWGTLGNMAVVGRALPARADCTGNTVELIP